MIKQLDLFKLIFIFFIFETEAQLNGDPGSIIAIEVNKNYEDKGFTIDFKGIKYKLIPLPFNKQGEYISHYDSKIFINKKDFGESRITIENTSLVNLNKTDLDRAYRESKIIQEALASYSKIFKSDLNFIKPVEGIISSKYGKKRFINDKPRSPHLSLDIAAPTGTKIVAPDNGKVILIGDYFYAGNYIIIDHGFGLLSSYSHLSKINVVENQIVKKNEKIGEIGATGRVTGPHLHWTVYFEKVRINPELVIQDNFLESLF